MPSNKKKLIITDSSPEFSLYRGDTFWAVFFGTLTGWTGTYCVKQTQVQRYCCMGSPAKAKRYVIGINDIIIQMELCLTKNPLLEYSWSMVDRFDRHLVRSRHLRGLLQLRPDFVEAD